MTEELRKKIEKRAYEFYLARGGAAGDPHEDWVRAEREIMAQEQEKRKPQAPATAAVSTPAAAATPPSPESSPSTPKTPKSVGVKAPKKSKRVS